MRAMTLATSSEPYRADLQSYFSLTCPGRHAPLHSWAPYLAYLDAADPSKARMATIQRRHINTFRSEVLKSNAIVSVICKKTALRKADTLESLDSSNDSTCWLTEQVGRLAVLDETEIRYLTRLLDSLALYDLAETVIAAHKGKSDLLHATWILSANFRNFGHNWEGLELAQSCFKALPRRPKYFGVRFALYTMLVVAFGQRKAVERLVELDQLGAQVLADVNSLDESPSHRSLHASKFYRAISYVPFVLQNNVELQRRRDLIYENAYAAQPRDNLEAAIIQENFVPALETCAKIDESLGRREEMLELLKKITTEIDAFDCKPWMQLGDAQTASQMHYAALESYKSGIEKSGPHQHILHYKTGQVLEKLGEPKLACIKYEESLRLEPNGFSAFSNLVRASEVAELSERDKIRNYLVTYSLDTNLTRSQRTKLHEISRRLNIVL